MDNFSAWVLARGYGLEPPPGVLDLTWPKIQDLLDAYGGGGCGPGRIGDLWVPDTIWGLNVKPCCIYHDLSRTLAKNIEDKLYGDWCFLNNLDLQIELAGGMLKWGRRYLAKIAYAAVCANGNDEY